MPEVTLASTAEVSAALSAYRRLTHRGGTRLDAATAATYSLVEGNLQSNPAVSGGQPAANSFYFDPADHAVSGKTLKLRLRGWGQVNSTAPAVNFTVGMYPVSAPAGGAAAVSVTVGTVVEGSSAKLENPAKNTQTQVSSGDFSPPSAGWYTLCVVVSGAAAASSAVVVGAELEMHWV